MARGLAVTGVVRGGLHAERGVGHGDQVRADGADGELCDALLGRPGALVVWGRGGMGAHVVGELLRTTPNLLACMHACVVGSLCDHME